MTFSSYKLDNADHKKIYYKLISALEGKIFQLTKVNNRRTEVLNFKPDSQGHAQSYHLLVEQQTLFITPN